MALGTKEDTYLLIYISSVDNTVQTFSSLVRKVWTIELLLLFVQQQLLLPVLLQLLLHLERSPYKEYSVAIYSNFYN